MREEVLVNEVIAEDGSAIAYRVDTGAAVYRKPAGSYIVTRPLNLDDFEPEGRPS